MTRVLILQFAALLCFLIGAIEFPSRVNCVSLGLFFWLLSVVLK